MGLLVGCLIAHALLADMIPWPWWVPNLTVLGLVLAIGKAPGRWLGLSGLAGGWTVVWAVRVPGLLLIGYLVMGWIVQGLARRWDTTEVRSQYGLVGMASFLMTVWVLWLDNLWSFPLFGLAGAHIAVTCAALPLLRLAAGRTPAR
jgi:hypothetical protein